MISIIYTGTVSDELLENPRDLTAQVLETIKEQIEQANFIVYEPQVSISPVLPPDRKMFTMFIALKNLKPPEDGKKMPNNISDS